MKTKYIIFLVFVLLFSYQNCSQKNLSTHILQQESQDTENQQKLSDLEITQVNFFVDKNSEVQKGSNKFLVKSKLNYQLSVSEGVLTEHDEITGVTNTFCLSPNLLSEINALISDSTVCHGEPSKTEICAQVIQEPYAELVTTSDVIQLGSATDSCGSNSIDLCENQSSLLRAWIGSVRNHLPELICH